jgi:hypothetical protein
MTEVVHAEEAMNQLFLDTCISTGVDKNRIDEFSNILMECLVIESSSPEGRKLKANLRKINIAEGINVINAHAVMEIDFNVDDVK